MTRRWYSPKRERASIHCDPHHVAHPTTNRGRQQGWHRVTTISFVNPRHPTGALVRPRSPEIPAPYWYNQAYWVWIQRRENSVSSRLQSP
eukprot:SAG25_NODE_1137_length_3822_cov_1.656460_5_plen_90_part_00